MSLPHILVQNTRLRYVTAAHTGSEYKTQICNCRTYWFRIQDSDMSLPHILVQNTRLRYVTAAHAKESHLFEVFHDFFYLQSNNIYCGLS